MKRQSRFPTSRHGTGTADQKHNQKRVYTVDIIVTDHLTGEYAKKGGMRLEKCEECGEVFAIFENTSVSLTPWKSQSPHLITYWKNE